MPEPLVAAVALTGANPFELSIASEFFGIRRGEVLRHLGTDDWYDYRIAGAQAGQAIETLGGAKIVVEHGPETIASADVVVVPMCPKGAERETRASGMIDPEPVPPAIIDAIRTASDRGATLMSYCSGSFAFAQAGLLDRRPATTHWRYAETFRRQFPAVQFVEDVLYVDDGDILTSAGSASGIDLTLHWMRKQHGAEAADMIARRLVVPPHREGGQAQYVRVPEPEVMDTSFAELLEWALEHLDQDLPVEVLAGRAAMSPRSFARHFKAATGTTPHQWLTDRRVDQARRLLETTDLPIDRVASASGLGSSANLRTRLRECVGVTPTAYRRRFARSQSAA
ncbi:helix-turn-helix domain-containing protein [Euzebya tangerina]|uniref:helix-turn-helix domain-containing protein n=1 Tax=Euzebya tangerina TaxID=591198 RepID=UPI000E3203E8|nr:helix-turn-helix domain-containing protein [Euzebya tangerina]